MVFAVGLLVGNVPEGLLSVITLALGVRALVRRGAVVKRLSAVETLGSTDVICTDKTGTLTENHMRVSIVWTASGEQHLDGTSPGRPGDVAMRDLAVAMAACTNAQPDSAGGTVGDPTEVALLEAAARLGHRLTTTDRDQDRRRQFHFDPVLKLMSTLDERDGSVWVDAKGAPEAVIPRCTKIAEPDGCLHPLTPEERRVVEQRVDTYARQGLRVLAVADRRLQAEQPLPERRESAELSLTLLGLVAMLDPPRPEVAAAVADCHTAGIRITVVSGDHALTAAAIAHQLGIAGEQPMVVTGSKRSAVGTLDDKQWSAVRASVRRHAGRRAAALLPVHPPSRYQYRYAELNLLAPSIDAL
ncbi:HAD family hydrolase [Streptomyces sp. NPDC047515]|uniref:HAD family hydrolase n=1 Tax=Streptomyces sp. NPDC047515 TaxID=3155380 RepID=UPI00340923A6